MHAFAKVLTVFLPLASGCATAQEPTPAAVAADVPAAPVAAASRPSARPALERVLEVVATPAAVAAGWELQRVDARGDGTSVRLSLDVDVLGTDEAAVTVGLERLLDALRGMDGARQVTLRSSHPAEPTRLRLSGLSLELASEAPRAVAAGGAQRDLEVSLRTLAADADVRLGGVDIERLGNEVETVFVSAHMPERGERLDRLARFMSEIEARHPDARVVRVTLKPAWRAGTDPAPEPRRYHWQIEVELGA